MYKTPDLKGDFLDNTDKCTNIEILADTGSLIIANNILITSIFTI